MKRLALALGLGALFIAGFAGASHLGSNYWLHCTGLPQTCTEEAVPTVTSSTIQTVTSTVTTTVTSTTSPPPSPPPAPPPTPPPPAAVENPLQAQNDFFLDHTSHPESYGMLEIHFWISDKAKQFRGSYPIRLIGYVQAHLSGTSGIRAHLAQHDAKEWVRANHPEWILRRSNGAEVSWWGGEITGADVGNPAYQQQWLSDVLAMLQQRGLEGVTIDDLFGASWWQEGGSTPAGQTPQQMENKVGSFLNYVCPRLKQAGYYVYPNIVMSGSQGASSPEFQRVLLWAKTCGNYTQEHWLKWAGATNDPGLWTGGMWTWKTDMMRAAVAQGVPFSTNTNNIHSNPDKQRYAYYSYLLWYQPSVGGTFSVGRDGFDAWTPVWTEQFGRPLAAATKSGNVWSRRFEWGTINVDPVAGGAWKT
jgi:putative glycosyl hydrolase-like family 15 (GHL15) protein